ncbi:uncharacterized protein BDV14DRAFT_212276 [Aspergillus stella-maris]|uniref:uncharacterized protein n=1 Tax=Aspergillus stella-maris TaxID=1810926 RepID=UPI003CCDCABF
MFITAAARFVAANLNLANYIGGVSFRPDRDIPDLLGKVVLVTGGNTGLGKESIRQILLHNPQQVFLAARTESKARDAIADLESTAPNVKLTWLPLDLSSIKSVTEAAELFTQHADRLDVLLLNAGVMSLPPGETDLGHEIQLGTNHTGHFLLTKLLLPILLKTAEESGSDVRVVSLSSIGHNLSPGFETILDQGELKKCNTHARYGASKAANILFAGELARRYPSLTAVSVHPGIILTDLYTSIKANNPFAGVGLKILSVFGTKVEEGAWNQLWAGFGAKKDELVNGAYYVPVGNGKPGNRFVVDVEKGRKLWEWTEEELSREPTTRRRSSIFERMFNRHPHTHTYPVTEEQPPSMNEFNVFQRRSSLGPDDNEKGETEVLERLSSNEDGSPVQDDLNPVQTLRGDFEERVQPEPGVGVNVGLGVGMGGGHSQGPGMNTLRRQRRNSRLQKFRDMLKNEEELDEAGKTYAKLM